MHNLEDLSKEVKNKEMLDAITPAMALEMLKQGNKRFLEKRLNNRDHLYHIEETISGQFPIAIIHSCIDSRVMPQLIFDKGIGDVFITRVAGNFVNLDTLGSMEYACAVAGSKLILILGHTSCGAIKGACDDVHLGLLTSTLSKIKPAIVTTFPGKDIIRTSENILFVDEVSRTNVQIAIDTIKNTSTVLNDLYEAGKIDIIGAMYNHATGEVEFC